MSRLADFEVVGKRAFYRPSGKVSFEQAVEMATRALLDAEKP